MYRATPWLRRLGSLFRATGLQRRLDPAEATGLALTVALAVIFLAGVGFGLLAVMVTSRTGLYHYDAGVAAWGSRHATPPAVRTFQVITQLGSTIVVVTEATLLGLGDVWRRRTWSGAAFLLTVVLGQNLLSNGVKLLVRRDRPPILPPLHPGTGYSYPSGHTTAAAATYAAMALLLGRGRRWPVRVWLAVAAAAVTVTIGLSRVLLGVHWLTDVLGGAMLGLGWFTVCAAAFGGRLLRFGAPVEQAEAEDARAGDGDGDGDRRGPAGEGTLR
ncbi:MAG TPA: phosphatase PAP2 family protein [Actinomycetes bacterium]